MFLSMDVVKLKNLIIWMLIISGVHCSVEIESINKDITITKTRDDIYTLTMDENNHNFHDNVALFRIKLDDCSKITITFTDKQFTNKMDNCIFYSLQSFDYESNQKKYILNIFDDTMTITQVLINVNNIDDENPILTCDKCKLNENTMYTEENSTCQYSYEDPDGFLSFMTFSINGDKIIGDTFEIIPKQPNSIDNATKEKVLVPLITLVQLDYETTNLYSFTVTITDSGNNSATQNAIVNVQDMRDTYPLWTKITNFAEFQEKSVQVFDVTAIDGDTGIGDQICYKITEIRDSKNNDDYDIKEDKTTGRINVNNIDRDKHDINMIDVNITACICNLTDWCTPQKLSYYIEDIDDHPPIIMSNNYNESYNQNFTDGEEKIVNVEFLENFNGNFEFASFIEDIDTGENAQFVVELEAASEMDYSVAYLIVPTAGYKSGNFKISVKDSHYLDYEDPTWRRNKFYVKSTGSNVTHTDHMLVNVTLIDYNDELPKFDEESYTHSINETARTGDFVLQAHATDRDAQDKVLKMEIVGTYAEKRLQIDPDGNIVVNLTNPHGGDDYYFDYDILNSVFFQVRAIDKVNHTTTVPVTLTILDVNNKAPMIDPVDPVSVEENQVDGIALNVTIKATDPDTWANLTAEIDWTKSYATKNSIRLDMTDKSNQEVINFLKPEISPKEGGKEIYIKLIVNNSNQIKPDFETFDSLYLNLVVTDLMTDPEFMDKKSTSEKILITIIDINDNPPIFPDSNNVTRLVQEGASKDTSVGFIIATDPDIGDTITYSCTPQEADCDWVSVDVNTGAFKVKEDGKVDADDPPLVYRYNFKYKCLANDGVHDSDPLLVQFDISDTNNKFPTITQSTLSNVSVVEKSKMGTPVVPINTADLDRDEPFHTVECIFTSDLKYKDCADKFVVDNNTIKVQGDLDRDHGTTEYSCKVSCHDNPYNVKSQGQNKVEQDFTIKLLDTNDHTPRLITLELEISENLKKGDMVGDIQGIDEDFGENGTIDFKLESIVNDVTGNDITSLFNLATNDDDYIVNETTKMAHLYTTEELKGYYGEYTIQLKLQDEGKPPNVAKPEETKIKFTIKKFVFDPPGIEVPKNNDVYLLSSTQDVGKPLIEFRSGNSIKDFTATDGATKNCSKWDITFSLPSEESNDNIFKLENLKPCISQLQVTKNFDSSKVVNKEFKLQINASIDSSDLIPNPDVLSWTTVNFTVQFLDNNEEPYFKDDSPWEFAFIEGNKNQTEALRNKASYDTPDELPVSYFLIGEDNIKDIFNVEVSTGDISVKKEFYYDDAEQYQFQILASNDSNQHSDRPNAYLNVTIKVLSTNRRPPSFTSDSFFGALMPTYKSGFPVVSITATDPDEVDKGKLNYSIDGDIEVNGKGLDNLKSPLFTISTDNDVGKIVSKFYVESSMSGYFVFKVKVQDQEDQWHNGPHNATTTTTVFIITSDNTIDFKFLNDVDELQQRQKIMLDIVTKVLGYTAYLQNIKSLNDGGQTFTVATLYFIDTSSTTTLIEAEDILKKVANLDTFGDLAKQLKEQSLYLYGFPSNESKVNTDAILRKWLLGVSIILGVFCLILLGALIWKTRQLNRRISKLTTKTFGSQESGLNRLGVSAPTTNKHAIEGSNPVYKNDEIKKPKESADFDNHSIRSGDSDLIGIENNPEFDYNFNAPMEKTA